MSAFPGLQAVKYLAEFVAVLSSAPDASSAARSGVELATEAFDAEMGAVLWEDAVVSIGFPRRQVPVVLLRRAAAHRWQTMDIPGLGTCHLTVTELYGRVSGRLLIARSWAALTEEELSLARAMARVLSLSLDIIQTVAVERSLRERSERQAEENGRLVRSLRERQRLANALSIIERSIARRAPLQRILDTVTAEARQFLADDAAMLRLIDTGSPSHMLLVSVDCAEGLLGQQLWRMPLAEAGTSRRAIEAGDVVVTTRDPSDAELGESLGHAIAAPVRENDTIVGSLVVASASAARVYGDADRQTLQAFADHVSLALTDDKTVQAMNEAFHDPLTGLSSRALFVTRLEDCLSSNRYTASTGLLFIDLNRFKVVNDTLGHSAGDQLLVQVADRIVRSLRAGDTASRFGGDEFAALLVNTTAEAAIGIADRIIDSLQNPYMIEGKQIVINASVGIAIGSPGQAVDELLRNADVAMYRAKRYGDGRREIFQPAMHRELLERVQMESDLRQAVDNGGLSVYYQPIVSLQTQRLKGFEALARWNRPGQGMVPPSEFIPLAEETGLILPIGRWILDAACQQTSRWQASNPQLPPLSISVNLSARQLQRPTLIDEVRETLASSGLPPERLILEITESLLHQDVDEAIQRLHELKALGVRLAVDDFGTGYSSLSCLHRFPVDIMKIDKSFVHGLLADSKAATFTRTIVRLGQMLNLETVGEGIENSTQLDRLREARCDFGQGYLFARPLDADQATVYLSTVGVLGETRQQNPVNAL